MQRIVKQGRGCPVPTGDSTSMRKRTATSPVPLCCSGTCSPLGEVVVKPAARRIRAVWAQLIYDVDIHIFCWMTNHHSYPCGSNNKFSLDVTTDRESGDKISYSPDDPDRALDRLPGQPPSWARFRWRSRHSPASAFSAGRCPVPHH